MTQTEKDSLVARLLAHADTQIEDNNRYIRKADDLMREAAAALSRPEQVVKASDIISQIALWADDEGLELSYGQGADLARRILAALHPAPSSSPAIGVRAVTTVDDIAKIIDPHSFLPDNSGDDLIGEMVKNGMEDARSKARRILSALHPAPEAASAGEAGIDEATMGRRWRVFEAIQHGWWGIEIDGDEEPLLYPIKTARETLIRLVDIHNTALSAASKVRHPAPEAASVEAAEADTHAFKNFHRLLCERFDYTHDEVDWRRDQVSLIEWIANRKAAPSPKGVSDGVREWQPMDSAPRDGTKFDVWYPAHGHDTAYRLTDVYWSDVQDDFCTDGQFGPEEPAPLMLYPRPTHWQPTPAAPMSQEG